MSLPTSVENDVDAGILTRLLKNKSCLHLKHAWWIDVGKSGNSVSVHANRSGRCEPPKRWKRCWKIAVNRDASPEVISVIEDIETFEPEQQTHALIQSNAIFDKDRNLRGWGASEC